MANTTFIAGTVIPSVWLNQINYLVYGVNSSPYLAVGDGVTDDYTAWQAAITAANAAGGGIVRAAAGSTYKLTQFPIVLPNVQIDFNGCTINMTPAAGLSLYGWDMRDNTSIGNGTLNVVAVGSPSGLNKDYNCNIMIGQSSPFTGYANVRVHNLTMSNNRADATGGTLVLIQADSNNITVENIIAPTSATLRCAVNASWAGDGGSPAPGASKHPFNIKIRNIKGGTITKAATTDVSFIDIVAAYNVTVENVSVVSTTGDAVVQVRPGAFGTAVAPAAVAPLVNHGIVVRDVVCDSFTNYCVSINGRAHGGGAIVAATYSIPVLLQNIKAVGAGAAVTANTSGIHFLFVRDCILENFEVTNAYYGLYIEEDAARIAIRNGRCYSNRASGVIVVHGTNPEDILLENVYSYSNGTAVATSSGFYLEACKRVTLKDCTAGGDPTDATQFYGFRLAAATAVDTQFVGRNRVRSVAAGGTKYLFLGVGTRGDRMFNGGTNAALSTGSTQYVPLAGVGLPVAAETDASCLVGQNMVLTNFQVKLSAAPVGATKTRQFRIVDDGGATALDITITDAATTGSDVDAVEVVAGSELSIISTVANTPNAARAKWSCEAFLN